MSLVDLACMSDGLTEVCVCVGARHSASFFFIAEACVALDAFRFFRPIDTNRGDTPRVLPAGARTPLDSAESFFCRVGRRPPLP